MTLTVAILGATGKTGREVLDRLLLKQDVKLRLYVRSRSKLEALFPSLLSNPRVAIFQGPLSDVDNMSRCLDGAQRIVFTIGENDNLPGVSVIEDASRTVIAALNALHETHTRMLGDWQRPRLLFLSSATWNPTLSATRPALVHWAIKTAFCHPYADLLRGQACFLEDPSLVNLVLVQPNGLVEDEPSGHSFSLERISLSVTYGDLGAAFVDLACRREYEDLSWVGVSSEGGDDSLKYGPILAYTILRGLCATFVPGFWTIHRYACAIVSALTLKKKVE